MKAPLLGGGVHSYSSQLRSTILISNLSRQISYNTHGTNCGLHPEKNQFIEEELFNKYNGLKRLDSPILAYSKVAMVLQGTQPVQRVMQISQVCFLEWLSSSLEQVFHPVEFTVWTVLMQMTATISSNTTFRLILRSNLAGLLLLLALNSRKLTDLFYK